MCALADGLLVLDPLEDFFVALLDPLDLRSQLLKLLLQRHYATARLYTVRSLY